MNIDSALRDALLGKNICELAYAIRSISNDELLSLQTVAVAEETHRCLFPATPEMLAIKHTIDQSILIANKLCQSGEIAGFGKRRTLAKNRLSIDLVLTNELFRLMSEKYEEVFGAPYESDQALVIGEDLHVYQCRTPGVLSLVTKALQSNNPADFRLTAGKESKH